MVSEVDLETFAAALNSGATVIDVREPEEYAGGHVAGARLMPLRQVSEHIAELPRDQPVYIICASGNRSLTAAQRLSQAGLDARSVAGGTGGWRCSGRPVVSGSDN
ncbi:rhodanese-like domain-containing protein [Mangrovihabitans endophyticus]|uniref:Rhodanese domain-containing protein n=1 Tax=Mangrovihabitans endophyticus TaxID=1751298 RepID=A0A8J3FQV6_9ACTN|nr:rhodanese-like domain-containing protein [Mangrovihabitans endophyticus]GGL10343.1 hypothetical protein GCM10012284_51390 [Mangrovihabitans endophyticus]